MTKRRTRLLLQRIVQVGNLSNISNLLEKGKLSRLLNVGRKKETNSTEMANMFKEFFQYILILDTAAEFDYLCPHQPCEVSDFVSPEEKNYGHYQAEHPTNSHQLYLKTSQLLQNFIFLGKF